MCAEGDGQTVLNSSTHREEIMLEVETLICLTHSAGVRNLSLSFTFIKAPLPRLEVSTEHQELFLKVPKGAWSSIKHVPLQRLANHLQSHHTSYRVSCSLRAKQSWPLANPLNDPTFMRICSSAPSREHLLAKPGNHRCLIGSKAYSWKPSSIQLLITHTLNNFLKNSHPTARYICFLVCLLFHSAVCFLVLQWQECPPRGMLMCV